MPVRDMQLLLPSFRERVELVLERLRARGFDPVVWETYRSPARAKQLVARRRSRVRGLSMHCYGAAVDIISESRKWSWPQFFNALGDEAKRLGLTWGGDWNANGIQEDSDFDAVHIQAVPVRLQDDFRALSNDGERDRYVRARLPMVKL